jgi:hypothetical protein
MLPFADKFQPKQKESASYAAKYRLLLTRALTLIRNHFSNALKDISADVSKRIADRQLNDTTMSALLYAKFRVGAPEMKQIGQELQKRAVPPAGASAGTEGEYQGLMNELHQSYAATRGKLLRPIISKKLADIAATPTIAKDLVSFARSCIAFIRGVCSDEYELWGEWFSSENMLYPFLESLCEPLYDYLRPKVIHETKVSKLCDFCTLIQRYVAESDSESEPEEEEMKLDFSRLIEPALHDAQDRLVFLAQAIVRNDIQYFKPKPEDLDYPRKASRVALSGTRDPPGLPGRKASNGPLSPVATTPIIVEEDGIEKESMPGVQEFYPTLRRATWLLRRIYRLLHVSICIAAIGVQVLIATPIPSLPYSTHWHTTLSIKLPSHWYQLQARLQRGSLRQTPTSSCFPISLA